jgi:hypothetical protein
MIRVITMTFCFCLKGCKYNYDLMISKKRKPPDLSEGFSNLGIGKVYSLLIELIIK